MGAAVSRGVVRVGAGAVSGGAVSWADPYVMVWALVLLALCLFMLGE